MNYPYTLRKWPLMKRENRLDHRCSWNTCTALETYASHVEREHGLWSAGSYAAAAAETRNLFKLAASSEVEIDVPNREDQRIMVMERDSLANQVVETSAKLETEKIKSTWHKQKIQRQRKKLQDYVEEQSRLHKQMQRTRFQHSEELEMIREEFRALKKNLEEKGRKDSRLTSLESAAADMKLRLVEVGIIKNKLSERNLEVIMLREQWKKSMMRHQEMHRHGGALDEKERDIKTETIDFSSSSWHRMRTCDNCVRLQSENIELQIEVEKNSNIELELHEEKKRNAVTLCHLQFRKANV